MRRPYYTGIGLLLLFALLTPMPGQGRRGQDGRTATPGSERRGAGRTSSADKSDFPEPLATFTGIIRTVSKKRLTVEEESTNTLEFDCDKKTRYFQGKAAVKPSAVEAGTHATVDARRLIDGRLEAVNVHLEKKKSLTAR